LEKGKPEVNRWSFAWRKKIKKRGSFGGGGWFFVGGASVGIQGKTRDTKGGRMRVRGPE